MKTITSLITPRLARGVRAIDSHREDFRGRRGAIGWSLTYLLFGGGLVGAVVIYLLVKMIGG